MGGISKYPRKVVGFAITGGNAANEGKFSIWYGDTKVAELYNSSTDLAPSKTDWHFLSTKYVCMPNVPLRVVVDTVISTNNGCVVLNIVEIVRRRRRRRRFRRRW